MVSTEERTKGMILEAGFDLAGITTADPLPEDGDRFEAWIAGGFAGEMAYLLRSPGRRADPCALLPGARSVLAAAAAHPLPPGGSEPVAAYARLPDYHAVLRRALAYVEERLAAAHPGARFRIAVDSAPLLERALAARAGLGWIGYSCNLITPAFGPFVLLGLLLTTLELRPDRPAPEGSCADCGACLEACPTGALRSPRCLDARKCIAYLTVEKRRGFDAREAGALGGWAFGCDRCTRACLEGRGWPGTAARAGRLFAGSFLPGPWDLEGLRRRCREGFKRSFRGTVILRLGKARLLRNVAAAERNRGGRRAP